MRWFASLLVVVTFAGFSLAGEKIDNPEFASWSKFKAGTTATWKMESKFDKFATVNTITTKLLEVTADKVVLEMTTVTELNGMKTTLPAQKRDVLKQIELPAGTPKPPVDGKPAGTTEEGTETLKAGGVEYKAKWYKGSMYRTTMQSLIDCFRYGWP